MKTINIITKEDMRASSTKRYERIRQAEETARNEAIDIINSFADDYDERFGDGNWSIKAAVIRRINSTCNDYDTLGLSSDGDYQLFGGVVYTERVTKPAYKTWFRINIPARTIATDTFFSFREGLTGYKLVETKSIVR